MSTALFPAFLKLAGRKVVVVGAGPVGASKIDALVAAGANVTVIAPDVVAALADAPVRIERRRFRPSDLDGAWFVVAAAPPEVNREVRNAAESRHVFVNAVDDLANATAYLGGVVRKQGVTLAISTAGWAPALAGLLREGLEALLPDDIEAWLDVSQREREIWRERSVPMDGRRPLLLAAINRLYDQRRSSKEAVGSQSLRPESNGAAGLHSVRLESDDAAGAHCVRPQEEPEVSA